MFNTIKNLVYGVIKIGFWAICLILAIIVLLAAVPQIGSRGTNESLEQPSRSESVPQNAAPAEPEYQVELLSWGITAMEYKDDKSKFFGEVRNLSGKTLKFLAARVSCFDKNDQIVSTQKSYVDAQILQPQQKTTFDGYVDYPYNTNGCVVSFQDDYLELNTKYPDKK
ncbi:MAG: hypothetical protein ACK41W_11345 [Cyanobacteriota bacterium]|jgi:hypothetical protein